MGPREAEVLSTLNHEFRCARSGGLLAVGSIEFLDHLVG
jgi:hypothetical protein